MRHSDKYRIENGKINDNASLSLSGFCQEFPAFHFEMPFLAAVMASSLFGLPRALLALGHPGQVLPFRAPIKGLFNPVSALLSLP